MHNPIHCITPPILLERIARNGSPEQRDRALQTMSLGTTLRTARTINSMRTRSATRGVDPLATMTRGGKPKRTIRDAENAEDLTGTTVREEGGAATGDAAVDEAYDWLGSTYEYYWSVHTRDSIDGDGMPLLGIVHYGRSFGNAFWDGQRMVFGDGDGELFNRFTLAGDVIGHELTHGVVGDEAGLVYMGQPGALNESVSDVFGALVKQYKLGQEAKDADWLIGSGLLAEGVDGVALRSMKEPGTAYDDSVLGKDPQPAHMKDYVETAQDNGGVHINSGIPNLAFYTTAMALGGKAWEKAGLIWYETLKFPHLSPNTRFEVFAKTTVQSADRLYGAGSTESSAVKAGWDKVGIAV